MVHQDALPAQLIWGSSHDLSPCATLERCLSAAFAASPQRCSEARRHWPSCHRLARLAGCSCVRDRSSSFHAGRHRPAAGTRPRGNTPFPPDCSASVSLASQPLYDFGRNSMARWPTRLAARLTTSCSGQGDHDFPTREHRCTHAPLWWRWCACAARAHNTLHTRSVEGLVFICFTALNHAST